MIKCENCDNNLIYCKNLCEKCYMKQYRNTHKKEREEYNRINKENQEIINEQKRVRYNKNKRQLMTENKFCTQYLGIVVAEQVLSKVFKNVEVMPNNNPGYDFICNHGKKIDVKSATIRNSSSWNFGINKNIIADYFLLLIFDNRNNLNPLYLWLIPSKILNKLTGTSISKSTISKWDEYRLDVNKVIKCCNNVG